MKYYWKNLINALIGKNLYSEELKQLNKQYQKTTEDVNRLNELYYDSLLAWQKADKQVKSFQTLTENLRQRIIDKDVVIAELQKELKQKQEFIEAHGIDMPIHRAAAVLA